MLKKLISVFCMAILLLVIAVSAGMAEETVYQNEGPVETVSIDGGISNDAALEGFINRAFGIGTSSRRGLKKAPQATRRSNLDGQNAIVYDFLYGCISQVASGNLGSTVFEMPVTQILDQLSYTAEDLDVPSIFVDSNISAVAKEAMYAKFEYDIGLIIDALLVDCPYELFWFDKTVPISYGYPGVSAVGDENGERIFFAETATLRFAMYVAEEYSASGAAGTTDYKTTITESITAAASNAQSIVTSNRAKSDWDKLKGFKNAVCNWVDYNYEAANENNDTPYGNPWQLVWVFDGDPDTKVVCEGYSKAFKYLCDQSSFRTNVSVAIVTGVMSGGTGAGRHMWNLVTMGDGYRYLVDVTNCDNDAEGNQSVGYPDKLFMVGYKAHQPDTNTYRYISADDEDGIDYTYDSDLTNLYSEEELAVNDADFDPSANPDALNKGQCGDSLNWELRGSLLVIRGSGSMYDFAAGESPWYQMSAITSVDLGGATSIGTYAFEGCANLSSVALPKELTAVGANAFSGCASLASVEYPGTQAQKAEISIGSGNEKLTAAEWQCGKLSKPKFSGIDHGTFAGSDFTAHIIFPSGAAMVHWEFGKVTENGELDDGPWEILSNNMNDQITVLGVNTSEPGTYRLRAQAWTHEEFLEEPADDDSEWAIYEFTLTEVALPDISDKVTLSVSDTNVHLADEVIFTVAGAEAVTSMIWNDIGEGESMPDQCTKSDHDSRIMEYLVGNVTLRIWGRFDGVWSLPYDIVLHVQPLGELSLPVLKWDGRYTVNGSIHLPADASFSFTADVPEAEYIWYNIFIVEDQGREWLDSGDQDGDSIAVDLSNYFTNAGEYQLMVAGQKEGYAHETKTVNIHVSEDSALVVADGVIISHTGVSGELVIPASIANQTIVGIGEFVFESAGVTAVTIPDGIKSIETGAFFDCPLTSVNVPAGVETKKWYFYERDTSGNPRVYSVDLPKSVTDADDAAFFHTKLPTVSPDFVTPSGLKTIDAEAFAGTSPTFVWLSDGVTSIGSSAFSGCSGLKLVRIPDGCEIGPNAFPAGTILCVEWNSEGEAYAQNNGYDPIYYVEGFNG